VYSFYRVVLIAIIALLNVIPQFLLCTFYIFVFHFLSHLLNRLGFRLVSLKDFIVDA